MISSIINFLLPSRCVVCDKVLDNNAHICPDCFNRLNFITSPYCKKCGLPFFDNVEAGFCGNCLQTKKDIFNLSRSALVYDDFSKKMILDFKFFDKTLNAKVFGKWMFGAGKDIFKNDIDVIIPVPLHFFRLLKRKYNQAGLLAKEVGKHSGIEVDYFSLKRKRHTKPQTKFLGHARIKNVKDAFVVKKPENIKGKKILLIDDVLTTGSTLRECAKALRKAGAKEINVLTLTRVV